MAFENCQFSLTAFAASAINAGQPVALVGAVTPGSALSETVVPAGSVNVDVFGVARATAAVGGAVDVDLAGVVKAIAAASIGAGARVVVGTTTGRLVPLIPSGLSTSLGSALGAQGLRFAVGVALVSAVDADIFTILLKPEQVV